MLRGRGFSAQDRAGTVPVMVVNEAMASALWPGEEPLGRQLRMGTPDGPLYTVVGVVENMRGGSIQGDPEFCYFLPLEQYRAVYGAAYPQIMIRVNGRAED